MVDAQEKFDKNKDKFIDGYITCMLWCGVYPDEDGTEHIDEFNSDDISEEDMNTIKNDCEAFMSECPYVLLVGIGMISRVTSEMCFMMLFTLILKEVSNGP